MPDPCRKEVHKGSGEEVQNDNIHTVGFGNDSVEGKKHDSWDTPGSSTYSVHPAYAVSGSHW